MIRGCKFCVVLNNFFLFPNKFRDKISFSKYFIAQ